MDNLLGARARRGTTDEWALYLIDPEGAVVAKRYQVTAFETVARPYRLRTVSEAEWAWLAAEDDADPYRHARELCGRLDPEVLKWSVSTYDARSDETHRGGLTFDETFALRNKSPVARRSLRWRFRIEGGVARLSVTHDSGLHLE